MKGWLSDIRTAQVLLSVGVLEFFGPILRDMDHTHLLNPEWVGHARFHMMWMLVFMFFSGVVNLALIWVRPRTSNLFVAWAWQACNVLGFWGAAALVSRYDGLVIDPTFHMTVFGLNENLLVFVLMAIWSLATFAVLLGVRRVHAD